MIITAPVTDYIRASILTANGDMVLRGAADPGRLAAGAANLFLKAQGAGVIPVYEGIALSDTGIHIGDNTRAASGAQVITGVGFHSSVIIMLAKDTFAAASNLSWGWSDGTTDMCVYLSVDGASGGLNTTNIVYIDEGGGDIITGTISAIGGDGFTITWTVGGACAALFTYLCLP